jgi:hypothetical protein
MSVSKEGKTGASLKDFSTSREVLGLLKIKVSQRFELEKVTDDSFDYITTWQLVTLMHCSCYAQLLDCFCSSRNLEEDDEMIKKVLIGIMEDFYAVFICALVILTVRLQYTRWSYMSEYLISLSSIAQRIARMEQLPIVVTVLASIHDDKVIFFGRFYFVNGGFGSLLCLFYFKI